LSPALDLRGVRPIADVGGSLEAQATAELLQRVVNIVEACSRTQPDDHVSFSLSRVRREWCARVVSGPTPTKIDVMLRGVGPTFREALLDLLDGDSEEDDDRPELVNEYAEGEVGHA